MSEEHFLLASCQSNTVQSDAQTLHGLFKHHAHQTPQKDSVVGMHSRLSYHALDQQSDELACHLQSLGVKAETLVGICMPRTPVLIITIVAILKAGGAYVPIDPAYPSARKSMICDEAKLRFIVTDTALRGEWIDARDSAIQIITPQSPGIQAVGWRETTVQGDNLAYVLYTSGSSGKPKGVMVSHSNVLALLNAYDSIAPLGSGAHGSAICPVNFDVSVWEIFSILCFGGTLHLLDPDHHGDPHRLTKYIAQNKISSAYIPPTILTDISMELSYQKEPITLHRMLVGVEPIPQKILQNYRDLAPNLRIINGYGPTETTICSTFFPFDHALNPAQRTPIGKAAPGYVVRLLDQEGSLVTPEHLGEIYIGGTGLSRGYLRHPDLTAERFVPDPFNTAPGARLYRSGDVARLLADGNIEFIERSDQQVKVRGYRIELGEIEATLAQHPTVDQCLITTWEGDDEVKQIVAYIRKKTNTQANQLELQQFLQARLPLFMVPAFILMVEAFETTAHGKIDRRKLPQPSQNPSARLNHQEPATPTEKTLYQIWTQLFQIQDFGIDTHFFTLGGHSLLATRLTALVRQVLSVELPLRAAFDYPTITQLAHHIDGLPRQLLATSSNLFNDMPILSRSNALPLSFAQERIWFIEQLYPESRAYNFQATFRFKGHLDIPALRQSLNTLIQRHEIFRTTFHAVSGEPLQTIHPSYEANIELVDLLHFPPSMRGGQAAEIIAEELGQRFDIAKLPLIRWKLLQTAPDEYVLIHIEHHLLHDGWSFTVFIRELFEVYAAITARKSVKLPDLPFQFADLAVWQRNWMKSTEAQQQLSYWRRRLTNAPQLILPFDHPRGSTQSFNGAAHRFDLPLALSKDLKQFSREMNATLFMVMFSAFTVLLYRYSGNTDLCVGTGVANRRWNETEGLIGALINNIVLRMEINRAMTLREVIEQVVQTTHEAYSNQDMPFDKVVEAVAPNRNFSHNPLFQVAFSFHDNPMPRLDIPDLDVDLTEGISNKSSKFDMNVIVIPRSEQYVGDSRGYSETVTIVWEYNTDLFNTSTVLKIADHYQYLLSRMGQNLSLRIDQITLADSELAFNISDENGSQTESQPCLHHRFEQQAEAHYNTLAVSDLSRSLTYGELNRAANQVARELLGRGADPARPIALFMQRSTWCITAILGVLKFGGSFAFIDPALPQERIAFMLDDIQPEIVLTESRLAKSLLVHKADLLSIDRLQPLDHTYTNLGIATSPQSLAYLIYTSGSSGQPKAVCCTHQGVVNLLDDFDKRQPIQAGQRCSLWTNFGFDVSLYEAFSALNAGASLHIVPDDIRFDGRQFVAWLANQAIEHGYVPPFMIGDLLDHLSQPDHALRLQRLLVGVEPIPQVQLAKIATCIPGLCIINGYGPTEASICATLHKINPADTYLDPSPIGHSVQRTAAYLLNPQGLLVPPGVAGEIYLGGMGLAHGYWNRPDLTAAHFVPDPFGSRPGQRLYRTGDIARHRADGELEFIGRKDNQVKIRGFRIEPGEIEIVLGQYPSVRECVVVARTDSRNLAYLAAYVVCHQETSTLTEDLYNWAAKLLPDYMIPSTFVVLESLPVTSNGKIDRKSLPEPHHHLVNDVQSPNLDSPFEQTLAAIWSDMLSLSHIRPNDNFFTIGGHSLIAIRVIAKIKDLMPIDISLREFFLRPTVRELAHLIERRLIDTLETLTEDEANAILNTLLKN